MMNRLTGVLLVVLPIFVALTLERGSDGMEKRPPLRMVVFVDLSATIPEAAQNYWRSHLLGLIEAEILGRSIPGKDICVGESPDDRSYCRDIVQIRPIHANTHGSPLWLTGNFPGQTALRQRLVDGKWKEFEKQVQDSLWTVHPPYRQNTQVYAAFSRVAQSGVMANGSGPDSKTRRIVVFYSDMIHDASPIKLDSLPKNAERVQALAQEQVRREMEWLSEEEIENLKGVDIMIIVPPGSGVPKILDRDYLNALKSFWRSFGDAFSMGEFRWE